MGFEERSPVEASESVDTAAIADLAGDAAAREVNQTGINNPPKHEVDQNNERRKKVAFSISISDGSWQDEANCQGVDPDLFFPERGASTREAKETCRGCVVRLHCLEYALVNGEKFGVWGGLSERERRKVRRQRALTGRRSATV